MGVSALTDIAASIIITAANRILDKVVIFNSRSPIGLRTPKSACYTLYYVLFDEKCTVQHCKSMSVFIIIEE